MKEPGKIIKCKEASLETTAKVTHTLVLPITVHRCKSWTVKKADREKRIHLKYGVGGELCGYPGLPEGRTSGSLSKLSLDYRWRQK